MRSALFYPEIAIGSEAVLRTSLLLWDTLSVIVPFDDYVPHYENPQHAEAWELLGHTICPDGEQKDRAHRSIEQMLRNRDFTRSIPYDRGGKTDWEFQIWPGKFANKTWELLRESQLTNGPLGNGRYGLEEAAAISIMAKISEACAGNTYARVTDRVMAFGVTAEGGRADLAQTVVPLTLDLVDLRNVPLSRLIDFRKREAAEGSDYTKLRHAYSERLQRHIGELSRVTSANEATELTRQFREDMEHDLADLKEALRLGRRKSLLSAAVVSLPVAALSWWATGDPLTTAALTASPNIAPAFEKVASLFEAGLSYNEDQRKRMSEHPMAYMYALSR